MSIDAPWPYTTKISGEINILHISDIHLGHSRNKTEDMVKGLYELLPPTEESRKLDFLIITGDLYDSLLDYNDPNIAIIEDWGIWLLHRCKELGICLILLNGTPGHDADQGAIFNTWNNFIKCDFKYITGMEFYKHEPTGVTFVGVQDKWHSDPTYTLDCVIDKIQTMGLTRVDFLLTHGSFDYQVKGIPNIQSFDSQAWQELVRFHILHGHHHDRSQWGKILVAGSWDRMTQNDEIPKGYLRITCRPTGSLINFIENLDAKTYIAIVVTGMDEMTAIEHIDTYLPLRDDSYISVQGNDPGLLRTLNRFFREKCPQYHWARKYLGDKVTTTQFSEEIVPGSEFKTVPLTKSTIRDIVLERAKQIPQLSDGDEQFIMTLLERYL